MADEHTRILVDPDVYVVRGHDADVGNPAQAKSASDHLDVMSGRFSMAWNAESTRSRASEWFEVVVSRGSRRPG